jgi:hypothetical protein
MDHHYLRKNEEYSNNPKGEDLLKTKSAVKITALAVLMPMLILAFSVAPAQACSDHNNSNDKSSGFSYEKNIRFDHLTIDLYQVPLTPEQLAMLNGIIPIDDLLASGVQYLYIDGMAHINLLAKERCDKLYVNLHIDWHGTIALLDHDKNVVMSLHSNCLQICAFATVSMVQGNYQADIWLSIHTNSMCRCYNDPSAINLKFHFSLSLAGSDLDQIEAQLPDFADALGL